MKVLNWMLFFMKIRFYDSDLDYLQLEKNQGELRGFTPFCTLVLWRSTHMDCFCVKRSQGDLGDSLGEEWDKVALGRDERHFYFKFKQI